MADYWKSNAKKYCQICKVWYADNKISAENHERGLKHKAMVQQRLRESTKKALEKEKKDAELQRILIQMEQAALASMSNDEKAKNSQKSLPLKSHKPQKLSKEQIQRNEYLEQKKKLNQLKKTAKNSQFWDDDEKLTYDENLCNENNNFNLSNTVFTKNWVQAISESNKHYYWHIYSGETQWEKPVDGYYTTEEYYAKYAKIAPNLITKAHFSNNINNLTTISLPTFSLNSKSDNEKIPNLKADCQTVENLSLEKEISKEFIINNKEKETVKQTSNSKLINLLEMKNEKEVNEIVKKEEKEKVNLNVTYTGLGPWIPVEKKKKIEQQTVDLPINNEKDAIIIMEETELDEDELTFKEKVLPENKKKAPKTIIFNKRLFKGKLRSKKIN